MYCPKCGRTDADIGGCGAIITPCPDPRLVDQDKVLLVLADGVVSAIPLDNILKGKLGEFHREVGTDISGAKILHPAPLVTSGQTKPTRK